MMGSAGVRQKGFSAYRVALWLYATLFYILLYAPLLMIVALSFNRSQVIGFPMRGLTTAWYVKVLHTPVFIAALWNSLAVGALAAALSTLLALLLAMGFRHEFRFKGALFQLVLAPVVMPGIVGGIVLLMFFGYLDLRPSLWTTVLVAHVDWVLPFAFLTLYPRLHNFDRAVEEAAMDLGARPAQVFWHVVLPIVRPAIVATMLFSFSLSFDEFVRTLFVTGYDRTIPVMFWSMIVDQLTPDLPAMAVIIILISATTSMIGLAVSRRARDGSGRASP